MTEPAPQLMIDPRVGLFLNGNVPSSKNSKRIVRAGKFPKLIWSKLALAYRGVTLEEMARVKSHWDELVKNTEDPLVVCFHFIRNSRRKFDFHNAVQTLSDLMVEAGWLEDDDMDHFLPVPLQINGNWYSLDKEAPGVILQPGVPAAQ